MGAEPNAKKQYDAVVARIREYVLDYCLANQEDWKQNVSKIANRLEITEELTQKCMNAERWSASFATLAMVALEVIVPKYPEEHLFTPWSAEDHEAHCQCMDCGVHTQRAGEYYCLRNQPWYEATWTTAGEGMLCIGCVENRLGRGLTKDDFEPGIPINETSVFFPRSERFLDRLSK